VELDGGECCGISYYVTRGSVSVQFKGLKPI